MAEKMSVTVRVYDQEQDDLGRHIDICSYDDDSYGTNLVAFCTENETYILDAEQVRRAVDNATNVWYPSKRRNYF